MAYEPKPGQGSLFPNKKSKDTQPDWQGDFMGLDGVRYRQVAWLKDGRLNTKIEPYQDRASAPNQQHKPYDDGNDF